MSRPGARTNLTTRVVSILKRGEHTFDEILADCPGFTSRQLANCLSALRTRAIHGIGVSGKKPHLIYRLGRTPKVEDLPLIDPVKPLQRDPFALWRLCERAPFDPARDVAVLVR